MDNIGLIDKLLETRTKDANRMVRTTLVRSAVIVGSVAALAYFSHKRKHSTES